MQLSDWQAQGQYHTHRGQRIFYRQDGAGSALVLLHGFPTASWDWHKLWPQLTAHYTVIAPDFPGFGFSDKGRDYDYSIMDSTDMIEALLSQLNITTVQLLAHDYGDSVAQELIARYYDRQENGTAGLELSRVTLLNGGLFPGTHHPRFIQRALATPLGILLTPFLNRSKLARNFSAIFGPNTQASQQEIDEFYALINYQNGKYIFHKLIRYMREREVHQERWQGALTANRLPIRFINGNLDPISGSHVAKYYRSLVPDADVVDLPNIGHYPQTEAPQAVLTAFLAFQ